MTTSARVGYGWNARRCVFPRHRWKTTAMFHRVRGAVYIPSRVLKCACGVERWAGLAEWHYRYPRPRVTAADKRNLWASIVASVETLSQVQFYIASAPAPRRAPRGGRPVGFINTYISQRGTAKK